MADRIRRVEYCYAMLPDKPGEGARILETFNEAGVNLLSFTAFPAGGGMAQVDFVAEDPDRLARAAKKAGIALSGGKTAFFIQGKDRPGAVAEALRRLAGAGVNVHASNAASGGGGGFGMILWVKPADLEAAAKALGV
jgi:hypothetical protein